MGTVAWVEASAPVEAPSPLLAALGECERETELLVDLEWLARMISSLGILPPGDDRPSFGNNSVAFLFMCCECRRRPLHQADRTAIAMMMARNPTPMIDRNRIREVFGRLKRSKNAAPLMPADSVALSVIGNMVGVVGASVGGASPVVAYILTTFVENPTLVLAMTPIQNLVSGSSPSSVYLVSVVSISPWVSLEKVLMACLVTLLCESVVSSKLGVVPDIGVAVTLDEACVVMEMSLPRMAMYLMA